MRILEAASPWALAAELPQKGGAFEIRDETTAAVSGRSSEIFRGVHKGIAEGVKCARQ
jgi:hypothetical protein